MRSDVCPSAMQWNAKAMEQPSVSTSPRLMVEKSGRKADDAEAPATGGAVMSTMPMNANAAPRKAFQRGGCAPGGRREGTIENRGTSTTTSPVMNADFDGVVRTRPMV